MDTTPELATALAIAQSEIVNPKKNKTVRVTTKAGGTYTFDYADLAAVTDAIRAPLAKNGLSILQMLEQDENKKFRLLTVLVHSSGQRISSRWPLFVEEGASQQFGSALTFMRRYSICALLCLAADDDDDANLANGHQATPAPPLARKPKPPAPNVLVAAPETEPDAEPDKQESPSEMLARLDLDLAAAAESGDRRNLESTWDHIPRDLQKTLRRALDTRHWPRLLEVEGGKR